MVLVCYIKRTDQALIWQVFLEIHEFKKALTKRFGRIEGKAAARLSKLWLWDDIFFCKCADSTSHYLAKQLWGLEKPIWPSSKFDSGNDDEMKSRENMVFQIRSQVYLIHSFFEFETKIILFSFTNLNQFYFR